MRRGPGPIRSSAAARPSGTARRAPAPSPCPRPEAAVLAACLLAAACGEPEAVERATVLPAVPVAEAEPRATAPGEVALCVDTARSLVRWRGTEVAGDGHAGVVRLAGGELRLRDGAPVGGAFTVDMGTIAVTDIPPHEVEARRQLRRHLSHEEFFAVDRFPVARLVLTDVRGGEHGLWRVSGNLAIRDSTHNVTFEATAPVLTEEEAWATADFAIDRQLWGITFDGRTSALRDAIVHDLIRLEVGLVARRCGEGAGESDRKRPS